MGKQLESKPRMTVTVSTLRSFMNFIVFNASEWTSDDPSYLMENPSECFLFVLFGGMQTTSEQPASNTSVIRTYDVQSRNSWFLNKGLIVLFCAVSVGLFFFFFFFVLFVLFCLTTNLRASTSCRIRIRMDNSRVVLNFAVGTYSKHTHAHTYKKEKEQQTTAKIKWSRTKINAHPHHPRERLS